MANKAGAGFEQPHRPGTDGRLGYGGKWARALIAAQDANGLWGTFHSLAVPRAGMPLCTEQALLRLWVLGYTAQDAPIARTLDTLRKTLRGDFAMPGHREITHDWDLFTALMMAAWLRLFVPGDPDACAFADRWARVVAVAFAGGTYNERTYANAYTDAFGIKPRGARFEDFVSFYTVILLAGRLEEKVEAPLFDHLLAHPGGVYYVYGHRMDAPPPFAGKAAARYLAALALLARYRRQRGRLAFAADWLHASRLPDGGWDLGPGAADGVYLPLSDDWRQRCARQADCTDWVGRILSELT